MQSDPRSQNLYLTLYYSTISIRLYVKSLEIRIQNRYSKKKKSIVNKYCRRSNPNDENLPCFERERVKKIREKKEGRLFIIMMKKKKTRTNLFIRRAWVVACVADVLACPAPVPTSWRRPWIHRIRWSPAYNTKPQKRFPGLPRKRWLHPLRCPRRRCTGTEFVARDSPHFARNTRTVGMLPNSGRGGRNFARSRTKVSSSAQDSPRRLSRKRSNRGAMELRRSDSAITCKITGQPIDKVNKITTRG